MSTEMTLPQSNRDIPVQHYGGMCDASAGVPLTLDLFAVANDEDNKLRIYDRNRSGLPVQSIDLSHQLAVSSKSPEADIEGAARMGDAVYWITSHARNKNGKPRPNRHRFFATTFTRRGEAYEVAMVGRPYSRLLDDLIAAPQLKRFNLAAASKRAPKSRRALNIEGLSATSDGKLLIGFRNPIPDDKALIVPFENPGDVLGGARAQLGDPILLDLGGLGVRAIIARDGVYLIVAGSHNGSGAFKLFRWRGPGSEAELIDVEVPKNLNPEAVLLFDDTGWSSALFLSDDGTVSEGGTPCKELAWESDRSFRAFTLNLESAFAK